MRDLEGKTSLSAMVRERATFDPDGAAYLAAGGTYSWSWYDETADRLAAELAGLAAVPGSGMGPGARVAVWLPDSPRLHAVYLACERAGLIVVGVPDRAGDLELGHLLRKSGASLLICPPAHRERTAAAIVAGLRGEKTSLPSTRPLPLALHAELGSGGTLRVFRWGSGDAGGAGDTPSPVDVSGARRGSDAGLGIDDLWLLNSTSGTTGLPKCVEQTQRKWLHLAQRAVAGAALTENDVIMSAVPGPFGYGLWTAHLLPALLGIPCVLRERFDPDRTLRAVAGRRGTLPGHRVTVLACVTTQLRLMLASPLMDEVDWSALRVTFTGGERTPPEVIAEWERRTGSAVLQFYGSNEFGGFSGTTLADSEEARRCTAGRVLPAIRYRLYDDAGADITPTGGPGQPGGTGPGVTGGYYGDPGATAELYHPDGYQLLPDLVTVDTSGYVRVTGRKADLIIRGGKNISAAAVETEVAAHPSVAEVAAIAVPDRTFGERVCAAVTLRPGAASVTVATLREFLAARGVSKEYFPEHVVVLDEMPVSMGGKIARDALRARVLKSVVSGDP